MGDIVDPRDLVGCACPRSDARDCYEVRNGLELRYLLGDDTATSDDDACECGCHQERDDVDEDELCTPVQREVGDG